MADIQAIEKQLQQLRDLEEIRSLKNRYAYLANIVDGEPGDPREFAALFTETATLDLGMGLCTGRDEIEAMMKSATTQWKCAMHYMLNPLIEINGDRADGKVTGLFAFTTEDNPSPIWLSNIYTDTFARTDEGWRFQSVTIQSTFVDPEFLVIYADLLE